VLNDAEESVVQLLQFVGGDGGDGGDGDGRVRVRGLHAACASSNPTDQLRHAIFFTRQAEGGEDINGTPLIEFRYVRSFPGYGACQCVER